MFSQGLWIIIIPCLVIVLLIFWAWFPFWIFVKAFKGIFGTEKPENSQEPVRAEEDDKSLSAEGVKRSVIQPPVLQPPVVQPTAFDPEYFQQTHRLDFDPREAKRRLAFKNRTENEVSGARADLNTGGNEVETLEPENLRLQGVQRRREPSRRNLPPQAGEDTEGSQRPKPVVKSDQEAPR
ncbi:hypothetical protein VMCG_08116 [Cytospora schulzeri]|uniref:Uncharacterized protein n=1 Tax=Cytospora schulzeri TaxID=448051 RepID=A0A423VRF6_9PEZI|nr:hypothetical protein VMCG_08116 [Valsa malicola]